MNSTNLFQIFQTVFHYFFFVINTLAPKSIFYDYIYHITVYPPQKKPPLSPPMAECANHTTEEFQSLCVFIPTSGPGLLGDG